MKIAIFGHSGAGKSTLARALGERYDLPILHLDAVHFLPGWKVRELSEKKRIMREFMDSHAGWVIDGNFNNIMQERRLSEADEIVLLLLNWFSCLFRVFRRYFRYRNDARPDVGEGCPEKNRPGIPPMDPLEGSDEGKKCPLSGNRRPVSPKNHGDQIPTAA